MAATAVEIDEHNEKLMCTESEEDSNNMTDDDLEDSVFLQRNLVTPVKEAASVVKPSVADLVNCKYEIHILSLSAIVFYCETKFLFELCYIIFRKTEC